MTRSSRTIGSSLLVPALAIATLPASPAPASPAANPEANSASIAFGLPANNGLHADLETFNGKVTLEIKRKGRIVSYEVEGESTEAGLKVKFGKLGLIDVAFTPTKTRTEQPPKGCKGKPSTFSEGLFTGTIEFTGELDYVQIEGTQAKGTMEVNREREWRCHRQKGAIRIHGVPRLPALGARRQPKAKKEPATLAAVSRRCNCFFAAYAVRNRKRRGWSTFVGAQFEKLEGMEIARATFANAGASAFVFDHAAGTAKVHPPQPFTGDGTFKRRPHGRDLWRSTIQVPLLGADPLRVGDPGFRAGLVRELPGGE
jgi:hypothetical protein